MESAFLVARRFLEVETATEYKEDVEWEIVSLREHADKLVGKEHHKERAATGKAIAELRSRDRYIDACRVLKGLAPLRGHFENEAAAKGAALSTGEAARLAAEAENALKELGDPATPVATAQGDDDLMAGWWRRVARLEAKLVKPLEAAPRSAADAVDLERIAREVVDYRERCDLLRTDPAEDSDLQLLEARLDTLAGAFLPTEQQGDLAEVEAEAQELREWERRLIAKLAHCSNSTAGLKPSAAKEVEQLVAEIAELKATLRSQGLTEHEQDKDERVLMRSLRVAELRQREHREKKDDRKEREDLRRIRGEVDQLGSKIKAHKRRLQDEKGYNHKDLKHDPEVCELEERFVTLQRMGGA